MPPDKSERFSRDVTNRLRARDARASLFPQKTKDPVSEMPLHSCYLYLQEKSRVKTSAYEVKKIIAAHLKDFSK